MEINHQAPLVAHREVFIQALPEVVWKAHTDVDNWSQWQPGMDKANLEGPLATGSIFQLSLGCHFFFRCYGRQRSAVRKRSFRPQAFDPFQSV